MSHRVLFSSSRQVARILTLVTFAAALSLMPACRRQEGPVVLIGVDGAEWNVLRPLIAQGRLPNFGRLIERGSSGTLESLDPMLSPIIWTTIATGREPDEHGITWFMERDSQSGKSRPITSRLRRTRAIWNIASAAKRKVGVVGWWASWPAEQVNGWVVSDHVSPHGFGLTSANVQTDLGRTFPAELYAEVEPLVIRPSQITDADVRAFMKVTDEELATRRGDKMVFSNPLHHFIFALAGNKTYAAIGNYMLSKLQPDLGMIYFEGVDSISHLFMKYADPSIPGLEQDLREKFKDVVARFYERQDRVLGELLTSAGPQATVMVVSDHGFKTGERRLAEVENTSVKQAHLWHEKNGVVIVAGPHIKSGVELAARVQDVTPTLLYLLDIPVAKDMNGRVLAEAIDPAYLSAHPIRTVPTYETPESVAKVNTGSEPAAEQSAKEASQNGAEIDPDTVARLAALGYIDSGETPEILLNEARIAMGKNEFAKARAVLTKLTTTHPEFIDGALLLGSLEEQTGRWTEAEAIYARAAKSAQEAKRADIERRHSRALLKVGRSKEAEPLLRELLRGEANADDQYHLGLALEQQGRLEDAASAYREAVKLQPSHAAAHNNLGSLLLRAGNASEAKVEFTKAAAADSTHAESRYNLALLLERDGKAKEAIDAFKQAAAANAGFAEARWALAVRAAKVADFSGAEKWLSELCTIDPARARGWSLRARVAAAQGRDEQARQYLEQAQKIDPEVAAAALREDARLSVATKAGSAIKPTGR